MQTIAIAGVGLIGGSFGLALRKSGFAGEILGVSSPGTIAKAIARGAIDSGAELETAAASADLLFLAQPISAILESIDRVCSTVKPGCLVTDAGSTKAEIVEKGSKLPNFLGGHPIAGKEATGVDAADADLFADRPWVLTPREDAVLQTPQGGALLRFITGFGAVPVFLSAENHDRTVAFTSHLPQMISTALACCLNSEVTKEQLLAASGPGVRDMTRLAMSSWPVWQDIIQTNSKWIQHALSVYIDTLTEIRDNLQTPRTGQDFSIAADVARYIRRGL